MRAMLNINGIERKYPVDVSDLERLLMFIMGGTRDDDIITEVKIDGQIYSEDYKHQAREKNLSGIKVVEIETETNEEFAEDFIRSVPLIFDQVENGFSDAAVFLRDPLSLSDGYDLLHKCFEVLQNLKNQIEASMLVLKNENLGKPSTFWGEFNDLSDEIISAQEKNDPILIANILDGRIPGFLDHWKTEVAA